jgi:hypothetical protein
MADAICAPNAAATDRMPAGKDHLDLDLDFDGRVLGASPLKPESSRTGKLTIDAPLGDEAIVVGQYASDLFLADDALSARALVHRAVLGRPTSPALLCLRGRGAGGITVHVTATAATKAHACRSVGANRPSCARSATVRTIAPASTRSPASPGSD